MPDHELHAGVDVDEDGAQGRHRRGAQAEIVLQFVENRARECPSAGSRPGRRSPASPRTRRSARPRTAPSPPVAASGGGRYSRPLWCSDSWGTDCSRSAANCLHTQPTYLTAVVPDGRPGSSRGGPWVISVMLARVLYSAEPSQREADRVLARSQHRHVALRRDLLDDRPARRASGSRRGLRTR